MIRKKILLVSLISIILVCSSVLSVGSGYVTINDIILSKNTVDSTDNCITDDLINEELINPNDRGTLDYNTIFVEKTIWDGEDWVDSIDAELGDTLKFKIYVFFEPSCGVKATDIEITDTFPSCLSYIDSQTTVTHGDDEYNDVPGQVSGQTVIWRLTDLLDIELFGDVSPELAPFYPASNVEIIYYATVDECDSCQEQYNHVEVDALETCCHVPLFGEDIAIINIDDCGCCDEPDIEVTKLVKENCDGVYASFITMDINDCDWVTFKIIVENTGDVDLDVTVEDELPSGMTYEDSADPDPDDIIGDSLFWYFEDVEPGETIIITFRASVDDCDEYDNFVYVTGLDDCEDSVSDSDSATVDVIGCCCDPGDISVQKYVKKECSSYYDHITFDINDYDKVTFKLVVEITRDFDKVSVIDELPDGLSYKSGSSKIYGRDDEPVKSGGFLYWDFTDVD